MNTNQLRQPTGKPHAKSPKPADTQPNTNQQERSSNPASSGMLNLDIMGDKFRLNFPTSTKRFQTRLGGCITLLTGLITLAMLTIVTSRYFDTSSPIVTTSRELSTTPLTFNLYGKDLLTPLTVSMGNQFVDKDMSKFITVKAQIIKTRYNWESGSVETDLSKKFDFVPCSQIEDKSTQDYIKKILPDVLASIALCPNFKQVDNQVILSDDTNNQESSYLVIKVYPCSLPDSSQCASLGQIHGSHVNYGEQSNLISPSNYHKPIEFRSLSSRILIDTERTKSITYALKYNKIMDDRQHFKKPSVRAEYGTLEKFGSDSWQRDASQFFCSLGMIESGACQEYLEFSYEMHSDVVITRRNYKKIATVMGEFGGVLKLLTTAVIIFSIYYSWSIKSYLFGKVMGMEDSCVAEIDKRVRESISKEREASEDNKGDFEKALDLDSSKASSEASKEPKEVSFKKVCQEIVKSRSDALDLMERLNFIELLEKALLEEHHEVLLPLALLKAKQNQRMSAESPLLPLATKRPNLTQNSSTIKLRALLGRRMRTTISRRVNSTTRGTSGARTAMILLRRKSTVLRTTSGPTEL